MSNVLVIAEHDGTTLRPATLNAVTAGVALGTVTVLVAGSGCAAVAEAAARVAGVASVRLADGPGLSHAAAEVVAPLVAGLAGEYTHLLAPATASGKNLMPRLAALLDAAPVSDVVAIVDGDTFVRPIYAGNALATVRCPDPVKVLTVRATAFAPPPPRTDGGAAPIAAVEAPADPGLSVFVDRTLTRSDRPELTSARIVVAGGRGMQSAEHFERLEAIADKLGAALGASRAAVDSGFVPNDCQVGQTGKVVAPDLYIAVGISGAIQHLAGMKDSKVIVAINKDEDAPIFQVADYGLVADLFEVLPELSQALDSLDRS